jgi:IS5 family transposase
MALWHMAHIRMDADSDLVQSVVGTSANANDVTKAHKLLHGHETDVLADAGYQGVEKRNADMAMNWHVAMRPGKRKALDLSSESESRAATNSSMVLVSPVARVEQLVLQAAKEAFARSVVWRARLA